MSEQTIEELKAALAKEKAKNAASITVKEGNKRNISVYNLGQRFPITLYAVGWMILIENIDQVKDFLRENHARLDWKDYGDPFENGDPFA